MIMKIQVASVHKLISQSHVKVHVSIGNLWLINCSTMK